MPSILRVFVQSGRSVAGPAAPVEDPRTDRDAWREQAQRKRLTWRGLFGGGKAE